MKIQDIKISDGPIIKADDEIEIYYKAATSEENFSNGIFVEKTYNPDIPIVIKYSPSVMLLGVYKGLDKMASGGSIRRIIIEPELGFGDRPWRGIPPNSTLVIEICLAKILSRNSS